MDAAVRRLGLQAIPWMGQTAHAVWERLLQAFNRDSLWTTMKLRLVVYSGQ